MSTIYKTTNEAYQSLKTRFQDRIGDTIQIGSVIDTFTKAIQAIVSCFFR